MPAPPNGCENHAGKRAVKFPRDDTARLRCVSGGYLMLTALKGFVVFLLACGTTQFGFSQKTTALSGETQKHIKDVEARGGNGRSEDSCELCRPV